MRIFRETQDSQSDINRFAMLGALTIVVMGAGFWGLRSYAQQGLNKNSLEAPWVVSARSQQGVSRQMDRGYNDPVASREIQESVARLQREKGQ